MATKVPSPLASSIEKTNGVKLTRLLIDGGTTVLRKVFDGHHPPSNLAADLSAWYSTLNNLLRRRVLNRHQWDELFPPGGTTPDSKTFDITLLFLLLTNICGLSPPPSGWHTEPPSSDSSHEANLVRIKFYRNKLYGHVTSTGVDTATFFALWREISVVLVGLGLDPAEIEMLKAEKGGEQDYLDALLEWANSEEDIKSQLKTIQQSHTETQKAVEEVRQTQTKTQQTMEGVCETQIKTQQTVEEVAAELQGVKEAFDSLKEGRRKNKADEILRILAKAEFREDIEYYVHRFQADTREWVFDRVQNWLDDRNSQNRVMVISGNAGMGKSVIAAVICKRMQEAGRLSGSHFCQYNNVRYRKTQLMLQSLAYHLTHALPEYKQALLEQLSRNLGIDFNNLGVEELFALLFKEPLSDVGDPGRNLLMVIDGLDESEYQGRNELLDVIANQFSKLPSWNRFLVTTRPATNIVEKLNRLSPFQLEANDEKNLEDIKLFLERKLQHVVKPEIVDVLVEKLVLRTEGLMLFANFLVSSIENNTPVLNQGEIVDSLPSGISSVYYSYFKRLESELMKELDIEEEHFLNLLCAITAAREPLPIGFVSKVLVPRKNSPLAKRKVLRALGTVSALLPIRCGCLHIIHRSVKDWLTDTSCYEEHEFIMDEKEGHRILADLCTNELDGLKRKGVHDESFSATEKYALNHGVRHMLYSEEERRSPRLEKLLNVYVLDLELVYAKTCVKSTTAAEDLVWLRRQGISAMLSEEIQSIFNTLLFLLRKYHRRFTINPRMFFQTMLNEGGTVVSAEASNLLQSKYPEIPYMEHLHKDPQQGGVVARFQCSSQVACLDVSPKMDYMVCECWDGMLQLWSLHTGRLVWTRQVMVKKRSICIYAAYRQLPSSSVWSFYRSVVFHPTEEVVLPGILSHAYTIDGDLKPLFPESNCRFSVCSISGDKTKIVTYCPDSPKCLVMWSLKSGSEIARITRNEHILTFAWSRDGRLLAISHLDGLICLVDVMDGFRTLAQTTTSEVCGMVKFSPDHRFLFCLHSGYGLLRRELLFRLIVKTESHRSFSLDLSSDEVTYDLKEVESFSDCGFALGDPFRISSGSFSHFTTENHFVLNKQTLLKSSPLFWIIEMLNTNEVSKCNQATATTAQVIDLSLDGQTMYSVTGHTGVSVSTAMAWNVSSGELIAKKRSGITMSSCLVPVRGGVLFTTSSGILELWNFELAQCIQRWTNLVGITEVIPISEERVACVGRGEVNVLDTTSEEIVSTVSFLHRRVIACNSKCQFLTIDDSYSLQLSDGTTVLWTKDLPHSLSYNLGVFSPVHHFLVIAKKYFHEPVYVLDGVSGNTLQILCQDGYGIYDCKFVSDKECVVSRVESLQLFNVMSGDLLSVIDVKSRVSCLAACPYKRLLAVGLSDSAPNFIVIQVYLPRDEDSSKSKRMNKPPAIE